jgi:3',5'-cyclic AMP phosphodiesterase CpdA
VALLAISDLHIGYAANRAVLNQVQPHPTDWLILAGDIGETVEHLALTLDALNPKFARLIWVPGNHELWTRRSEPGLTGVAKYQALVEACRRRNVLTPEDPYPLFVGRTRTLRVAPMFVLYDYSFAPLPMTPAEAVEWAIDQGVLCSDEAVLSPDPYTSRAAWCAARVELSERRLAEARQLDEHPLVLINHFPLRREHVHVPRFPAFALWCGTERTRDWPARFGATDVVYGHLHMPGTKLEDNVRYHEVSLGYPGQWNAQLGIEHSFRIVVE